MAFLSSLLLFFQVLFGRQTFFGAGGEPWSQGVRMVQPISVHVLVPCAPGCQLLSQLPRLPFEDPQGR